MIIVEVDDTIRGAGIIISEVIGSELFCLLLYINMDGACWISQGPMEWGRRDRGTSFFWKFRSIWKIFSVVSRANYEMWRSKKAEEKISFCRTLMELGFLVVGVKPYSEVKRVRVESFIEDCFWHGLKPQARMFYFFFPNLFVIF